MKVWQHCRCLESILLMIFLQLEKTQKELSRLQQINRNMKDEHEQDKERHLKELIFLQVKDTHLINKLFHKEV